MYEAARIQASLQASLLIQKLQVCLPSIVENASFEIEAIPLDSPFYPFKLNCWAYQGTTEIFLGRLLFSAEFEEWIAPDSILLAGITYTRKTGNVLWRSHGRALEIKNTHQPLNRAYGLLYRLEKWEQQNKGISYEWISSDSRDSGILYLMDLAGVLVQQVEHLRRQDWKEFVEIMLPITQRISRQVQWS